MDLETINKLFLELSRFTTATTANELSLQNRIADLEAQLAAEKRRADELAAHCARLWSALHDEGEASAVNYEVLRETPCASLAHIKAQAMREVAAFCLECGCPHIAARIEDRADELEAKHAD